MSAAPAGPDGPVEGTEAQATGRVKRPFGADMHGRGLLLAAGCIVTVLFTLSLVRQGFSLAHYMELLANPSTHAIATPGLLARLGTNLVITLSCAATGAGAIVFARHGGKAKPLMAAGAALALLQSALLAQALAETSMPSGTVSVSLLHTTVGGLAVRLVAVVLMALLAVGAGMNVAAARAAGRPSA